MSKLHITDKQYLDLMKRIRKDLDSIEYIESEDSTTIGNKHTSTNIGLCASTITDGGWKKGKYTTLETAMWPEDFKKIGKTKYPYPQQFTMKYVQSHHKCPLEYKNRSKVSFLGCFYRCRIFQEKYPTPSINEIKKLYDMEIKLCQAKKKS